MTEKVFKLFCRTHWKCPASSNFSFCHSSPTPLSSPLHSSHLWTLIVFTPWQGNCHHGNQVSSREGRYIRSMRMSVYEMEGFPCVFMRGTLRTRWNIKAGKSAGSDCDGNSTIRAPRGQLLHSNTKTNMHVQWSKSATKDTTHINNKNIYHLSFFCLWSLICLSSQGSLILHCIVNFCPVNEPVVKRNIRLPSLCFLYCKQWVVYHIFNLCFKKIMTLILMESVPTINTNQILCLYSNILHHYQQFCAYIEFKAIIVYASQMWFLQNIININKQPNCGGWVSQTMW